MAFNPMEVFYERRCAKYIYTIPAGLTELMSDISREVIRDNTKHEQMYTFIADYLDSLLITRENCRVATQLVNNVIATGKVVTSLMREADCSKRTADYAAKVIQTAYRAYLSRKRFYNLSQQYNENVVLETLPEKLHLSTDKANTAAIIIQRAFRNFRQLSLLNDDMILDWRFKAQRTIGIYRQCRPTNEELHKAATLIKAAYKGYYTRRRLKELMDKAVRDYYDKIDRYAIEEIGEDTTPDYLQAEILQHAKEEYAALAIQRTYRGYLVRKLRTLANDTKILENTNPEESNTEDYFNSNFEIKKSVSEIAYDDAYASDENLDNKHDNSVQISDEGENDSTSHPTNRISFRDI